MDKKGILKKEIKEAVKDDTYIHCLDCSDCNINCMTVRHVPALLSILVSRRVA